MRAGLWRLLMCVAVLTAGVAVAEPAEPAPAPPPVPKAVDSATERAQLQAKLADLLKRLEAVPPVRPDIPPPMSPPTIKPKVEPSAPNKYSIDPIREGMNLFRDNDFEAARRVFQLIDTSGMPKGDRAFVRYMFASSLRRTGRATDAETVYREVANSGDDEFLASYATQQIYLIGSERELQTQLEQLRARAKSK